MGTALVDEFTKKGFFVLAQYRTKKREEKSNCDWIKADFSHLNGIRHFLEKYREKLKNCTYLINNYGPITSREIQDLKSEDFLFDFFSNVITTFEITNFFINNSNLQSTVNIGFEFAGDIKPYQKVLTYAIAKNSLLLMTEALAKKYHNIQFNMVSPASITGAAVRSKTKKEISPPVVAKKVFEVITGKGTGLNYVI